MISFREIADRCDGYDGEVEELNQARKEFWAEIREVLPARDVRALKAAIKARRKRKADRDGEEAYEARVAEILEEIERGTEVALAHARRAKDLPAHDEETGEIIEPAVAESAPAEQGRVGDSLHSSVALQAEPVQGVASEPAAKAIEQVTAGSHFPSDDPGPLPDFLRRVA